MNPRLSAVIPTYARGQVLCDTLRALLAMDLERCEVIVIDQNVAHEPATRDYLASIADRITHVRLDPPSLARARNLGWKMAAADIVLYLDDDVIPHAGLLDGHAAPTRTQRWAGLPGEWSRSGTRRQKPRVRGADGLPSDGSSSTWRRRFLATWRRPAGATCRSGERSSRSSAASTSGTPHPIGVNRTSASGCAAVGIGWSSSPKPPSII